MKLGAPCRLDLPRQSARGRRRPQCVSAAVDKPHCGRCGAYSGVADALAARSPARSTPEPGRNSSAMHPACLHGERIRR